MRHQKEIKRLKDMLKELRQKNIPEVVLVDGSEELGEFFEVDGVLMNDVELLENLKQWEEQGTAVIIDDWCNRCVEEDEIVYFPSQEDKIDYIRVEKGVDPMYHDAEKPYNTITKEEWLALLE